MIDIVKLANGNVALYDTTSGDFLSSLSPDIVEIQCNINGTVKVIQDNGNVEYFDPANISNTQVLPAAAIAFSGNCADLALLLSTDFFFVVSGGGVSDLATVLAAGNSAGANDIDLNGNDLLNVAQITDSSGNFGNYGDYLQSTGTAIEWQGIVYTVELMDALTVDFYAPYDLKINTTTNIKNAPTITIQDDGAAYTLTNTISVGSKITITASVAGVTNLNITKA
jgi:hypothetical protein